MSEQNNLPPRIVVESAIDAHDTGYEILARWLNEGISACAAGAGGKLAPDAEVRVTANTPPPGITFEQCQNKLCNALAGIRPFLPDLDRDDRKVFPWVIGYLGANTKITALVKDEERVLIQVPAIGDDEFESWHDSIERRLNVWARDWDEQQWVNWVKHPVEQHAAAYREKLFRLLPDASESEQDDPQFYPDEIEEKILLELLIKHPRTVVVDDLVRPAGCEERTLRGRLGRLSEHELVHRPNGPKAGVALTTKGVRLARYLSRRNTRDKE